MTPRLKGVLIALAGTTAWATTGIFISYLLTRYNLAPLTLAFWRDLAVAATLIAILAVFQPQALRLTRRDVPFFLAYGFVALALFNGLWTYSVKFNGAAVATVLAYSSPAFIVLNDQMETITGQVALSPMHLAKGLEFRAVVVMACDDEIIPLQARIETVSDDSDLEEVYNTERHLLYVACTRARDHLLVTSVNPASEFLDDLRAK